MIDYGGPNVAKPLHVGHLRSAIIGESIKRIIRYKGNKVTGDIHLGDWGYQMGLIITELKKRQPDLPYFDESFEENTRRKLRLRSVNWKKSIRLPVPMPKSMRITEKKHCMRLICCRMVIRISCDLEAHYECVRDRLKKNYERLNVEFDLWKGEADAQKYIPGMVEMLKEKGFAHYDQGALVVDVAEETDNKEVPPCMILKSDGAALYDTTDLATLVEREELYQPDEVIYVVDKRQELHFIQVFRCAKKTGIVRPETELKFLGFGTMNGKDGKPFKTREGGVMRLENLIREIDEEMYKKIMDNRTVEEADARKTAAEVGLAAIKYGDLSIRHPRIISLMWTALHLLREIQDRISFIRSCVSSPSSRNMRRMAEMQRERRFLQQKMQQKRH